MTRGAIDRYLNELTRGLRLYPGRSPDVIDEVRDHLLESIERAEREGVKPLDAEQRAVEAFGDPRALAQRMVAQKSWGRTRVMLPIAILTGLVMALVDNQPGWDDTGVSAFAVVSAAGALSLVEPARPWLWAVAIGGWFPLIAISLHGNYGATLALLFALGAAYAGSFLRRAMAS